MWSAFRLNTLFLPGMLLLLTACATTPTLSQAEREAYLKQFIGQSSETIYANLDLSKLGYQQVYEPELFAQQLVYIVQRPVTIPLSVAQHPVAGTGTVPIPVTHSPSQGYDVNLQCKIVFELKDNIAQSVSSTGRTC
ncbi:hypothetical protein [Acinetobacter thermotolerans]|uniref:hypothetical protein n=1 Tax=Acinetobacter thermotolerans TaxID=3151487 RepID=UPI00325A6E81